MRRALSFRWGIPLRILSLQITYAEFLDWCRTFAAEPFDDRRCFDRPAAAVQSMLLAVHAPKSDTKLADLMPFRDPEPDPEPIDIDALVISRL